MTTNNLYIPTKIKVGYQKRQDTYTGNLAYVIYYDEKNVLRKEKSWKSWIDKKINPNEFNNDPTEGFVLNKNVGGYKSDWNYRQSHIRVYDPRGFEFEISVENLLFILQECNADKGKGLDGKFVYSWEGTELVLLPITSLTYQNSTKFTTLKSKNVAKKDLIIGATYLDKDLRDCIYVGNHPTYGQSGSCVTYYSKDEHYHFTKDHKHLKELKDPNPCTDYAKILSKFLNSTIGSPIDKLELRDTGKYHFIIPYTNNKTYFWSEKVNDVYMFYQKDSNDCSYKHVVNVTNGMLKTHYPQDYYKNNAIPKTTQLFAILKNGKEILITHNSIHYFYKTDDTSKEKIKKEDIYEPTKR